MKIVRASVIGLGVILAPGLFGAPPCVTCNVPEPSAIPELVLCLTVTVVSFLLWRRNRKPA
jgi:predicted cobalt transporter CbtA